MQAMVCNNHKRGTTRELFMLKLSIPKTELMEINKHANDMHVTSDQHCCIYESWAFIKVLFPVCHFPDSSLVHLLKTKLPGLTFQPSLSVTVYWLFLGNSLC